MRDLTANEMVARRRELDDSAALAVGRILFAFSRLEMNLGLMLTWAYWITGKDNEVQCLNNMNFGARLDLLRQYIERSPALPVEARSALSVWLSAADVVRERRNQLVHGRWASDPIKEKVVNVFGLPTSDAQETIEYSLAELEAYNQEILSLTSALSQLRKRWQLP